MLLIFSAAVGQISYPTERISGLRCHVIALISCLYTFS